MHRASRRQEAMAAAMMTEIEPGAGGFGSASKPQSLILLASHR